MKILVIVPTLNERENIRRLVPRLMEQDGVEVLVVDDRSPDGTAEVVRELQKRYPERLHLLVRQGPPSYAGAYLDGFAWARGRDYPALATMDADLSHPPDRLAALREALGHADLVIGSRYVRGGSTRNFGILRWLISRSANWYARTLLRVPIRDLTSGYMVFRRALLERVLEGEIPVEGYVFQIFLKVRAFRLGARIREVPICFVGREHGSSKFGWRHIREAIRAVHRLRGEGREGVGRSSDGTP